MLKDAMRGLIGVVVTARRNATSLRSALRVTCSPDRDMPPPRDVSCAVKGIETIRILRFP